MSDATITQCPLCGMPREGESVHCGTCGTAYEAPAPASAHALHTEAVPRPVVGGSNARPVVGVPEPLPLVATAAPSPRKAEPSSRAILIGSGLGAVVVAIAAVVIGLQGDEPGTVDASAPMLTDSTTASRVEDSGVVTVQENPHSQQTPSLSREEMPSTWPIRDTTTTIPGEYSRASALNDVTSMPFTEAVGRAYAESVADGSSTVLTVYSPVTKKTYTMTCEPQPDSSVLCTGGNNARVLLW